jgi:hypothetical protein
MPPRRHRSLDLQRLARGPDATGASALAFLFRPITFGVVLSPEQQAEREHRLLKDSRQRVEFLELQLAAEIERRSHVERLLHTGLVRRYFNEHKCSPAWLSAVQEAVPVIEGQRRDRDHP